MTDLEARILRLEAITLRLPGRLRALADGAGKVLQDISLTRQAPAVVGPPATPCDATITVTVSECDPYGVPTTPVAGVAVSAQFWVGGTPVITVTGTTDAGGICVLEVHSAGDWQVHADGSAVGHGNANGTATVACGADSPLAFCVGVAATVPDCICPSIPAALDMVVVDPPCTASPYRTDTLRWSAIPAGYTGLGLGDGTHAFLSDGSYADEIGQQYQWYFTCSGNNFTLQRVYQHSIAGTGGSGPFKEAVRYTWDGTDSRNSCVPFALIYGVDSGSWNACTGNIHLTDGT
jgi:hypothetical protein